MKAKEQRNDEGGKIPTMWSMPTSTLTWLFSGLSKNKPMVHEWHPPDKSTRKAVGTRNSKPSTSVTRGSGCQLPEGPWVWTSCQTLACMMYMCKSLCTRHLEDQSNQRLLHNTDFLKPVFGGIHNVWIQLCERTDNYQWVKWGCRLWRSLMARDHQLRRI